MTFSIRERSSRSGRLTPAMPHMARSLCAAGALRSCPRSRHAYTGGLATSRTIPGTGLLRWAEVDSSALRDNAAAVRGILLPSTALLAMVKSRGYGHGAVVAGRAAIEGGASWLGVYTPDEALELREAGIDAPVFVAGWTPPAMHAALIDARVDISVFDAGSVEALAAAARTQSQRARVHVKLDTGLGRLGVRDETLPEVVAALRGARGAVEVAGLFTHFADAESDGDYTRQQHERFLRLADELRSVAPDAMLHAAGTAGILNHPETHHDLVRIGIGLYGYAPRHRMELSLRPAMSVFARVAQVKTVAAGETVGYGRTWRAQASRRIATVAIGYGQGLPRRLSNTGHLVLAGARCPIVGTVSMDQVTVDVSDAPHVQQGDAALFIGARGDTRLGADEVAALTGTISYEILCGVSADVPRLGVGGEQRAE